MKTKTVIALLALASMPAFGFAQDQHKSNEELRTEYKYKIDVLNSEIKTLKAKHKAEPTVSSYITEMEQKKSELKVVKNKKSIVDKAIKSEKAMKKAQTKAEKAKKKAEDAARKAELMKKGQ